MAPDKVKLFTLVVSFKDAESQRDIKVKMVITDGATTAIYSDAGFAKKVYADSKRKGLKVALIPRKNAVVESYPGKTLEEIKEYELALLKSAGRKFKIQ